MELPTTKNFSNEPSIDFSQKENQEALAKAVERVSRQFGKTYPLIIGGKRLLEGELIEVKNPANVNESLGKVHLAEEKHLESAVQAAERAFETWRFVPYPERAAKLLKAAELARKRKLELSVWVSKENGKSIREAVAEVAEGIDFMDYYARRMNEIGSTRPPGLFDVPGEKNRLEHIPLGAGAIIAPWNFPFAILAGMTTAALVTGNTVVMKPSTNTPIIAYHVYEILEQAGFPKGVMNHFPFRGAALGDALVQHPRIRFIAFTGSTAVGKEIYKKAAPFSEGQHWFKRTILETGGKNHVIVCTDADLQKAVEGVARSAFGYSGQKCSACAVAVVEEGIYEKFVPALVHYLKQWKLGEGSDPQYFTGPVINEEAVQKIMDYIQEGKKQGRLLAGGRRLEKVEGKAGYYIEPTVFTGLPGNSRILREEIFGPVLAIRKAKSLQEALRIANSTGYGLTGGVFTKDPKCKELAAQQFHVGNLYLNKATGGSTGAMVGRQPFGGFHLSGTDSKVGGPNYLYLFMQEKAIADMS